ncbi:MAG: M23 family metallopeptidase [Erythrobacter sp.]|jgi:murein DD-endopeptidase MepM/ murein hydrolase activator NlpD|nr:M23 family metallopeptidase [Erythrobacter sp.]
MAEDRNSFDPKTWVAPGSSVRDGVARGEEDDTGGTTSFNPRTWVRPGSAAQPAGAKGGEAPDTPAKRSVPGGRFALPGFALGALALAGLAAFSFAEEEPVVEAAAAPAPAVAAKTRAPIESETLEGASRVIDVAGLADLEEQLITIGLDDASAGAIARETGLALGSDGPMRVELDLADGAKNREFRALLAELRDGTAIRLSRKGDAGFAREEVIATASTEVKVVSARMTHRTFYDSTVAAGLPDSLVSDAVKVFAFDFNFERGIPEDARFRIAWEEKTTRSGRSLEAPRLLFVELATAEEELSYYAFTPPGEQEPHWYDESGNGNESLLMQTPVDGARITSNFGKRLHPITGRQKNHNGVDFAAPTGTPIYAAGDATVAFAAPRGAAGNFVRLDHGDGLQTWYMHLDAFAAGLVPGAVVRQGEVIGFVGTTGGSTGPHLHYEIRVAGQPVPPLEFEFAQEERLEGSALAMFEARREATRAEMRFAEKRGGRKLAAR